jgi:hypothetical protein
MLFGQTSSPLYSWLKFGRKAMLHILCRQEAAKVTPPSNQDVVFYRHVIGEKYPSCAEVWGAADGLKLLIQEPTDDAKQNQYFNGWKHSHNMNCVFIFSPDGKICLCLLSAPGTFHDSMMADHGIYKGMEEVYERTGAKVVVDSAFNIVETNENMAAGRNKLCAPKRTYADVLTQRTYKPSGILLNNNG